MFWSSIYYYRAPGSQRLHAVSQTWFYFNTHTAFSYKQVKLFLESFICLHLLLWTFLHWNWNESFARLNAPWRQFLLIMGLPTQHTEDLTILAGELSIGPKSWGTRIFDRLEVPVLCFLQQLLNAIIRYSRKMNLIFESRPLNTEVLCGSSNQGNIYGHFTNVKPTVQIEHLRQKQQLLPLGLSRKLQTYLWRSVTRDDGQNTELETWIFQLITPLKLRSCRNSPNIQIQLKSQQRTMIWKIICRKETWNLKRDRENHKDCLLIWF